MSLHQLKPSTLSLSLLLLIWSFESPARSHPTPRVALHTGTLSEQGSRVTMCPRAPTLYYSREKLCLFESNWKEGCNLERSRLDLRASWGHRPPQVALSLYFYSQSAETIHHTVWKMTSIIRMIVMTILALKRNFFWLFVRACPQLPILSLSYPLSAPPNVTISPKKSGHYSAMLLKTQIITSSHPSQL